MKKIPVSYNINRFEPGEQVCIAIFHSDAPKNCRIVIAEIERDGFSPHMGPGPQHYIIKGHGVFGEDQVFGSTLDAITWLVAKMDERSGILLRSAGHMAARTQVIAALWSKCYDTHDSLTIPE